MKEIENLEKFKNMVTSCKEYADQKKLRAIAKNLENCIHLLELMEKPQQQAPEIRPQWKETLQRLIREQATKTNYETCIYY